MWKEISCLLLHVCDAFRCFWIVLEFRVVPVVGPLIIAVLQSFAPMIGMFTFMGALAASAFLCEQSERFSCCSLLLTEE